MLACIRGQTDGPAKLLLRYGADANAVTRKGLRAVDCATQQDRRELVQLLRISAEATYQQQVRQYKKTSALRRGCCSKPPKNAAASWGRTYEV